MMRTGKITAVVCALLFEAALATLWAQAQSAPPTPERIEATGRVLDSEGNGIPNATISLIGGVDLGLNWYEDFNPNRGLVRQRSDEQGRFTIGFDRTDHRFLIRGDLTLVVEAQGRQRHISGVPMARLLSDAPIEIRLLPEERVSFNVRDSEGKPLANARVAPASQQGARLPWCTLKQPVNSVTDSLGNVTLASTSSENLNAVFVVHPAIGNQRIPVTLAEDGSPIAVAAPTRPVAGKIESPDRSPIPGLAETRLFVVSVPLDKYQHPNTPTECGWAFVPVSEDGSFEIPQLQLGDLLHRISCSPTFAYRENAADVNPALDAGDEPMEWNIKFQKQPKLTVTILDGETGRPLPNIHISSFDGRLERTHTGDDGKASFFRTASRSSYYPTDATGQFFSPDAFYQYAKKPPANNEVEFAPFRMARSSPWKGRIVNDEETPVAGAKVAYEYSQERFDVTGFAYSNRDGTFCLTNVSDGTVVKLSASTDRHASETTSLVLPESDGMELRLIEQPTASPMGQLVDSDGWPVVGVSVAIKRVLVIQKEQYSREDTTTQYLYDPPQFVRSDTSGHFRFPATKDFAQRLRIEVRDPRYFPLLSPYIDASQIKRAKAESESETVNLGRFRIMRRPENRMVELLVTSGDGKAIEDAEIVFVGARTGKALGKTNDAGRVTIELAEGPCALAVRADGYHVHYGKFDARNFASHSVAMRPQSEPAIPLSEASVAALDSRRFLNAAEQLFTGMDTPDVEATTFHRVRLYLEALAALSPDRFAAYVISNAAQRQMGQAAMMAAQQALKQKPELIELAVDSGFVDGQMLSSFYLTAANSTADADLRMEWLGEALVSANQSHAKSQCVLAMMAAEEFELAKTVATELWENSAELRKIVETETREQKIGDARTVGPAISIINLDAALRLIELTAAENEIESLKTQALLNWGLLHRNELVAQLGGSLHSGGVETWLQSFSTFDKLGSEGLPSPIELSELIDAPNTRLKFLLFHAKVASNPLLRHQLIRRATESIREMPATTASIWSHYLHPLTEAESLLTSLPPDDLDQLMFAVLWNLPPSFDSERLHAILGCAARVLAYRNHELGRVLLEPAFVDRGWMFTAGEFDRNMTTDCVGRIDPEWSLQVVNELCEGEYRHDIVDRLELRSGMIKSLLGGILPN